MSRTHTECTSSPEKQTATFVPPFNCVDPMALRSLTGTASGKGGNRNTEPEVTTRVAHEGQQKLKLFSFFFNSYALMIDGKGDNWRCYDCPVGPFLLRSLQISVGLSPHCPSSNIAGLSPLAFSRNEFCAVFVCFFVLFCFVSRGEIQNAGFDEIDRPHLTMKR